MANMLSTEGGTVLQVGMTFNTQKAKVQLIRDLNKLEQKSKIQIPVEVDGTRFVKTIRTFEDSMKNLIQVTTMYNGATGETQDSITGLTSGFERAERAIKKQEQATQRLNSSQKTLNTSAKKSVTVFRDFANTFMKMAKFNTVNLIYDGLINRISEVIKVTNEYNAAMIEFQKVTDTSNLNLEEYTETLGKLGEQTAKTTTQMLQMSTEFSKGGFSAEDSAKLANVASLYQNIADAEISAGEAASFVISQMKAFDYSVDDAIKILDQVNAVSNNFAVSSSDVASALTKQSASLAAYGNTLGESIALVTSGAEIMTHQSGKVARGLRTIGANITQLAQGAKTFEIQVAGATKSIRLWNEAGTDMLNTYQVLEQISAVWDKMTNAERSSLAVTLAKKTQMDTFLAVLSNFETAEEAYTTALLSEGSALQENSKYMEGIEAHQQAIKAQWEQLILSIPFEELEKSVLSAGVALLKFANNDTVQLITKVTALVAVLGLLNVAFAHLNAAMLSAPMGTFLANIRMLIAGTMSLTEVTSALTASMLSNPLFLGATAIALIVGVVKAVDYFTTSVEEATEALQKINDEVSETSNTIQSLQGQIKTIGERIDELNAKKLEISNPSQLTSLQQQTNELTRQEVILRNQLEIEKQKLEAQRQQQAEAAKQAMNTTTSVAVYNSNDAKVKNFEQQGLTNMFYGNQKEAAEILISAMKRTQEEINNCSNAMKGLNEESEEYHKQVDNAKALSDQYSEMSEELQPLLENIEAIIEAGEDENGVYQSIIDSLAELNALKEESSNTSLGMIEDETDSLYDNAEAIEEATNAWNGHIEAMSDVQSAYGILSEAVEQYNEQGYFTADMLSQLNSLSPEYLAALVKEGEQYSVNTEELAKQFEAEKQDAIEKLELAKCIGTVELAQQYLNGTMGEAVNAIANGGNAAETTASQMLDLASASNQAAQAVANVKTAFGADSQNFANFQKDLVGLEKTYNDLIKNIKNTEFDLTKGGKGGSGSKKGRSGGGGGRKGGKSSASKAAKEHEDAWLEAFKNEQKALKHKLELDEITQYEYYQRLKELNEKYFGEISGNHEKYIKEYNENEEEIYKGLKSVYDKVKDYLQKAVEQGYEKTIRTLEKEEKAVLSGIKKKIDSLKKEKDSVLDGIQKEIDMLEKQRDETLDGIHKEIDALKKQKEEVEKYWNDQIDAIKRENEEIEEQNQLLEYQQALQQAKSQKVMVYQDGRFQLTENESAVADAEKALAEYEDQLSYEQQIRQMEDLRDAQIETLEERIEALESYYEYMEEYYEKQIEALEEYKEYMEEYYDSQIEAMEDYYDRVEEQYEKQIEALQSQLDAFKEGCQKAEDLENAKLAATVMAANEEAAVWQQRLENLADAITEYNRLLSLMGEAGMGAESTFSAGTASFTPSSNVSGVNQTIQTRAKGDSNFAKDEMALVGESPNAELVLGSRLNNSVNSGNLVHLSRGSGVVNAESTSTLAGLLNGLSKPTNVANNRSTQQNFTFGNISLPNVTDADSFVNTLSHKFNNYAIQYGNVRK